MICNNFINNNFTNNNLLYLNILNYMFSCFGKRSKIYIIKEAKNEEYNSYPRKFRNFIYI